MINERKTTEQYIADAVAVHGNKYDYSKVEYRGNRAKVIIICPTHGEFAQNAKSHLRGHGCPKCHLCSMNRLGVGVCDIAYSSQEAYYECWRSMLIRVYDPLYKKRFPTYSDCEVCSEWLTLSKFKKWFEDPDNGYRQGYHMDKDILVKDNKIYSPQTCCFVPQEINLLFARKRRKNGLPAGVTFCDNAFRAQICVNKKKIHLGCFSTKEEAFKAYKDFKERHIKDVAEKYFQEGRITKKVYDALLNYEVEMTD